MKEKYTKKELEMIREISPIWDSLINEGRGNEPYAPELFKILAIECFAYNKTGWAVESLRRCIRALMYENLYRNTPEFEALIHE